MSARAPGCGPAAAVAAVLLLAGCAAAHDAESLFTRLKSNDIEVRQDAAEELDTILRQGDYQVFTRALKNPNRMLQVESILYLARMPQPEARAALRDLLRVERRTVLPYNPIRLKPQSMETDSRILVAHLIAENGGDPEAVAVLLQGVHEDQTQDILTGTCFALGALRDPKGIPFLVGMARSPDVEVTRAAIQSLGHFRDPQVLPALRAAASHPQEVVRGEVLSALDFQEGPETLDVLERLAVSDPSPQLRADAIEKLPRFKEADLAPFLIERLKARDATTRAAALAALRQITGQSLGPKPEAWTRWRAQNGRRTAVR